MKITVDNETCIGCGMCISVCPEVFECADDGTKSVCKLDDIPEDLKEKQFVQQKRVTKELLLNSSKFDYELGILKEYNELIEKTYYSLCDLKNLSDL